MRLSPDYVNRQKGIRREILTRLYEQRAGNPTPPEQDYLWRKPLLNELGHPPDETAFAMGYLAEAGEILLDGHHVRITAAGIRAVETQTTNHQGE